MTAPTDSDSSDNEDRVPQSMTGRGNVPQRGRDHIEQFEWLVHIFFEAIRSPCSNVKRVAAYLMIERNGYKVLDDAIKWLVRNPFSSLAIFLVLLILLPFLLVIGFGISLIVISLTGFIVLEGTLLTFVSVLSFGCLGALVLVLTIISGFILAVYMGFAHIYDMYGCGKITALTNFLKEEHRSESQSTHSKEHIS